MISQTKPLKTKSFLPFNFSVTNICVVIRLADDGTGMGGIQFQLSPSKKLISKKEPYGKKSSFKYFIGYNDDDVIRPLCINFSQMIGCVKCFDSNKTIFFKVNDNKLLKSILQCCKELAV